MKNQKKILSLVLAGILTASVSAATVSAAYYDNSPTATSEYTWYLSGAGTWFKTYNDAYDYAVKYGYSTNNISTSGIGNRSINRSSTYTSSYHYYCSNTGYYYLTANDASDDALYNYGISNPDITDQGTTKYSSDPTSTVVSPQYPWYSSFTGLYYKTESSAIAASNNNSSYVTYMYTVSGATSTTASSTYPWYSSYTNLYYKTQSDAISASNGYSSYVSYVYGSYSGSSSTTASSTYPWYSSYTRLYYKTQSDALAASYNNYSYVSYVYDRYGYNYDRYGYDPYYGYYRTYEIASGTPYIVHSYGYAGWDNIIDYVRRSGLISSTIKITMNGATSVPSDLFQAIKDRNITICLEMDNGAKWTINGKDVVRVKKTDMSVEYNTSDIPESLVKTCSTDAVSKVQVKAGSDGDLDMDATLTVKFSKKRSGKKVYAYHYDRGSNQLSLVASGTIKSNGYVSFNNLDEGGSFLLIVK